MYCSISCSELWRKSIRVTLQDSPKLHYRLTCIRVRMRTFSPNDNESCRRRIRRTIKQRKTIPVKFLTRALLIIGLLLCSSAVIAQPSREQKPKSETNSSPTQDQD